MEWNEGQCGVFRESREGEERYLLSYHNRVS